jgi:ribosomal protein S18 acetylase RimI-like enzyme
MACSLYGAFTLNHILCALVTMRCTSIQMGYALGRIEDMGPKLSPTDYLQFDQLPDYAGHLASIATHAKFRGQGVAKALMERMHFNMAEFYGMDKVNLLCRVR